MPLPTLGRRSLFIHNAPNHFCQTPSLAFGSLINSLSRHPFSVPPPPNAYQKAWYRGGAHAIFAEERSENYSQVDQSSYLSLRHCLHTAFTSVLMGFSLQPHDAGQQRDCLHFVSKKPKYSCSPAVPILTKQVDHVSVSTGNGSLGKSPSS